MAGCEASESEDREEDLHFESCEKELLEVQKNKSSEVEDVDRELDVGSG